MESHAAYYTRVWIVQDILRWLSPVFNTQSI